MDHTANAKPSAPSTRRLCCGVDSRPAGRWLCSTECGAFQLSFRVRLPTSSWSSQTTWTISATPSVYFTRHGQIPARDFVRASVRACDCARHILGRARLAGPCGACVPFAAGGVVPGLLYVLAGIAWGAHWRAYQSAFANPEWAFLRSLADHNEEAFVAGKFPSQYLDDFMPARPVPAKGIAPTAFTPAAAAAAQWRPKNVVMLIGESFGSRYLGIYGAPYADTPEMEKLAQHGALFQRTYVSCPYSDNAIAALFTSVYPYHYWDAVLTHAPRALDSGDRHGPAKQGLPGGLYPLRRSSRPESKITCTATDSRRFTTRPTRRDSALHARPVSVDCRCARPQTHTVSDELDWDRPLQAVLPGPVDR